MAAFVIAGLGRPTGGALVDASLSATKWDGLRSLSPVIGRVALRRPSYLRLDLEELGGAATIRLRGNDPIDSQVSVTTEYTLHPKATYLRITTTLENKGSKPLLKYRVGDVIDWGVTVPFAPGLGHSPRGQPALVWLAAWSEAVSYAYFRRGGATITSNLTGQVSVSRLETLDLLPKKRVAIQRLLAVGQGGQVADLLPYVLRSQGTGSGHLHVTVTTDSGEPSTGARVDVSMQGRPFIVGRTGDLGEASLHLPPGLYAIQAFSAGRISGTARIRIRPEHTTSLTLPLSPPSRLIFDVRERGSHSAFPVKLTFTGHGGTPTPWLGPPFSSLAVNSVLSETGKGVLPLPPGRYRVIASHGPEFSIHSQVVTLRPHSGGSFTARLQRAVATPGYLGIDLGQQTLHSSGCGVSPRDRVLSNLVEGVDGIVAAESAPVFGAELPKVGGLEIFTIRGLARFSSRTGFVTVFPLREGFLSTERPFEQLFAPRAVGKGPIIQIDAGRRPRHGLFNKIDYDPQIPDRALVNEAFTALRVLDRLRPEDFDQLLEDWLSLLRVGRRVTATGASGSHSIFGGEAGYPRTYVAVPRILSPELTIDQIIASLRQGRALVSSGPFIDLKVDGQGPGAMVGRKGSKQGIKVDVTVSAPDWIALENLTLYLDGQPWKDPIPITDRRGGVRLKRSFQIKAPARDTFILALVRGSGTLAPVVQSFSSGTTLPPLALTNPVWIDVDGNGRYDP